MTFSSRRALLPPANSLTNVTISSVHYEARGQDHFTVRKRGNDRHRKAAKKERHWNGETQVLSHFDPYGWGHINESHVESLLCHLTCRRGRCWDPLNRLDRDFLRCLMELTLFYLCAISARALYAKRQSTSVDPAFAKKAPPQPSPMCPRPLLGNWQKCGRPRPMWQLWKSHASNPKLAIWGETTSESNLISEITAISPGTNFSFFAAWVEF